jgi:cytochrome oxidase Cu insertion factor (SCO1/SenC/PrrC family)
MKIILLIAFTIAASSFLAFSSYAQNRSSLLNNSSSKIPGSSKSNSKSAELFDFNWTVNDLNGKEVQLSQYKGKVIFLTFWATHCGICRGELPKIQSLWNSLRERDDIAFLLVSKDDEAGVVKKFLSKNAYDFPVFMRVRGQSAKAFRGQNLPVTYVIDQNGKILLNQTGRNKDESFSMSEFLLEAANKKP